MIWPGRWGTEAQGTHFREGEAGHNDCWREIQEGLWAYKLYNRNFSKVLYRLVSGS